MPRPNPAKFFGKIKESSSVYDGLDDVAQGKTDAVLVDTITLEFFKSIKPAVYEKNLRVLQKSKSYPAPVIAYKEGTFNAATLKILRDGLLKAHESPDGKLLLREWQINRFEPVPANYQEMLNATLKEHPVPESFTKVSRR
jgi:ABC-type phosphate/phosphonate transport system substrate-binding protein